MTDFISCLVVKHYINTSFTLAVISLSGLLVSHGMRITRKSELLRILSDIHIATSKTIINTDYCF